MTLGDRMCVMSKGGVQQIGTPDDIYNRPANTFVAAFMGSPPMNLLPGAFAQRRPAHRRRRSPRCRRPTGRSPSACVPSTAGVLVVGARQVPARIDFCEPLGSHVLVNALVEVPTARPTSVIVQAPPDTVLDAGTAVGLKLTPGEDLPVRRRDGWRTADP